MKKRVLFGFLTMFLIFSISFAIAENLSTSEEKKDKAYICLGEKVRGKCSSLSPEERIFSLLAIQECKDEVVSDLTTYYGSNVKLTAQAILALSKVGGDTSEAEEWLLSKNTTSSDINWYLEIESSEPITCTIIYSDSSYDINIGADKKINSGAGRCLSLAQGNYWLEVLSSCYNKEFEISCDNSFLTTLLFKKKTSSTIHVSSDIHTSSQGGTTTEKVNSFCFAQGSSCDYEGSLWATMVLDYLEYDVSAYLPYLITMSDEVENKKYIPKSFLYFLTGEFRAELLGKQINQEYWDESRDKYYDTALALLPFQYEQFQEKTNSIDWFLEVQDNNGCWEGNTRNTAFILYSIWPMDFQVSPGEDDEVDCEDEGYFCRSAMSCREDSGSELDYDCSGLFICCDKEKTIDSCEEQGGEICSSNQDCRRGISVEASDINYGEICCFGGTCEEPEEESECEEQYFGTCRTYECEESEEESSYSCDYGDICCIEKEPELSESSWWIWVLLLLIFLTILGIIFKDKLRRLWFRIKSKKPKSIPQGRPGFPSAFPSRPPITRRMVRPRRILPTTQKRAVKRPAFRKPKSEVEDVLKKLKEMGK
jgi:hypothetical protein